VIDNYAGQPAHSGNWKALMNGVGVSRHEVVQLLLGSRFVRSATGANPLAPPNAQPAAEDEKDENQDENDRTIHLTTP